MSLLVIFTLSLKVNKRYNGIDKFNDIVKCFTFFSGQVGGWKDHLTVRQSETIDRIFEEKLKGTDIKFTYEL